jgi:ATP-binding cassette ChvD family protein
LLEQADLTLHSGWKVGIVGNNGVGKSSLFKLLLGELQPDAGELSLPAGLTIAHMAQEVSSSSRTALEYVLDGDPELRRIQHDLAQAEAGHRAEQIGELHAELESIDGYRAESRAHQLLDGLGFMPGDAARPVSSFSGGWRIRLNLAQALMRRSDLLLLDEPTNHLDAESIAWIERFLQEYPGTVVAITHDRYFLDNAAGWILELDRGHGIPFEGNYSQWLENKGQRLEMEAKQEAAHQKAVKHELEWVRTNAKGRQSKSKARLARFEEMSSQEFQKRNETNELYIPPGPRLGGKVIEVDSISKSFGERLLYEDVSFSVPPGAIVGIIGGNGAGKSTLFRMIAGKDQPDTGTITVGETVELAYVDQMRDLNDDKTVWEELSDGNDIIRVGNYETPSRAYVGRFNFKGSDQQKRVGDLSGGERNRLHLAKLLKEGGNVLLLDEPTNDLDVETLRALEEALLNFPGSALVISHDRWFLDRVATHILAFEDDGEVVYFEGNFSDYDEDHKKRKGDSAMVPQRMKYKKLA